MVGTYALVLFFDMVNITSAVDLLMPNQSNQSPIINRYILYAIEITPPIITEIRPKLINQSIFISSYLAG